MAQGTPDRSSGNRREARIPQPPRRQSLVTVVLLLAAAVLVVDGIAGERGWLENRRAAVKYQAAERALNDARTRNQVLRDEIQRLRANDPAIIEKQARELGLVKPGEKLFIVKDRVRKDK